MKTNWKQLVLALVIGILLGTVYGRWSAFHEWERWGTQKHNARLLDRFTSKLHLSTDQKQHVAQILESNWAARRAELDKQ
jgi:prolipoprotein diacylglyceryltransferase